MALRKTLELVSERGDEQADLNPLFGALDADPATALDAVHDTANMPLDQEPQSIIRDLETVKGTG